MFQCDRCVNKDTIMCLNCRDSDQVQKILAALPKTSNFQLYKPLCPRGYVDCVYDPAYIKFSSPEWYTELYGDMTPEEALYRSGGCFERFVNDPEERYYCYDDEDK